jgi:hypothetical protein
MGAMPRDSTPGEEADAAAAPASDAAAA